MRLFFAVELEPALREPLWQASRQLAGRARGRFTARENLHLTLCFLGETDRLEEAQAAMRRVQAAPFILHLGEAGRFPGREGDTWWVGLQPCPALESLQRALAQELRQAGFALEARRFLPHLTLARQVRAPDFAPRELILPPAGMTVEQIALMESLRQAGRVVYRARCRQRLEGERSR